MKDLAPDIYRQRLIVEGYPNRAITADDICNYLNGLSTVSGMKQLIEPVTHLSSTYGWAGWVHWETSGAHFYAWDVPRLFFSIDMYTCKKFSVDAVVKYTSDFFGTTDVAYKEV